MYATYYVSQHPLFQLADVIAQNFYRAQSRRTSSTTCTAPQKEASQATASSSQTPTSSSQTTTLAQDTTQTNARTDSAASSNSADKPRSERIVRPRVRVEESQEAYQVIADLPGAKRESIEISVEDNQLRLSAPRELTTEKGPIVRYHQHFSLPERIQADGIAARYDNGVLQVTVPKAQAPQAVRIAVH